MNTKLVAIICGMPFSGTTFLSRMVTSHPLIESGFECGMLFGENPADFKNAAPKFYKWMLSKEPPYNWKLSKAAMKSVCEAPDFYEAYNRIVKHCELFSGDKQFVIDKTPAYVYQLARVMRKVPDIPVIIIQKEIKFQYHSYKKRGIEFDEFAKMWERSQKSIQNVMKRNALRKRILLMDFQTVSHFPGISFRKAINHIHKYNENIVFDKSYVPLLNETLSKDIRSKKKKLRPRFDYDKELLLLDNELTKDEKEKLGYLEKSYSL